MKLCWWLLFLAGVLEIGWAISLKLTDGWRRIGYLGLNVAFGLAAAYCLAQSMRELPAATAYPIWKGIAIIGIVVWEIFFNKSPVSALKCLSVAFIVLGILGLQIQGSH